MTATPCVAALSLYCCTDRNCCADRNCCTTVVNLCCCTAVDLLLSTYYGSILFQYPRISLAVASASRTAFISASNSLCVQLAEQRRVRHGAECIEA